MIYHRPVLLKESVDGLDIKPKGVYVDITFGAGGHSKEILDRLDSRGQLFAFDRDRDAIENRIDDKRFILISENFKHISRFLRLYNVKKVDGILGDLGVSSHQFDRAERGFSTRFNSVLDMRMNQRASLCARDVINDYKEADLAHIFSVFGELRNSKAIAKRIVKSRDEKNIDTSFDLKEVLRCFLPKHLEHKVLAKIYQAIRIEVNRELQALKDFLQQVPMLLNEKGRMSIISYHSLEDRLVKRFIREGKCQGEAKKDFFGNLEVPLKKIGKLIVPTPEEIKENNRARSAKLRIAELR